MQADMAGVLLAKGHEVGWGPLGPPWGCFSQSQQPLRDQASMPPSAIEGADDDSINVIAVHIVRLDLEPSIAAVVHLPCRVQCFNDDSFFLRSSRCPTSACRHTVYQKLGRLESQDAQSDWLTDLQTNR